MVFVVVICVGWVLVSLIVCKIVVFRICRFNFCLVYLSMVCWFGGRM